MGNSLKTILKPIEEKIESFWSIPTRRIKPCVRRRLNAI